MLIAAVPGWGGGMIVNILCPNHTPQMATVSPGVAEKPARSDQGKGEIIMMDVVLNDSDFRVRTVEMVEELPEGMQIDQADIVVSGGYGMKASGGLESLKELAGILGGALGGTRPVLDEGWIRESGMIGVSGKIISPKLLFSIGASGANHYSAGFVKAGKVVAVNNDPKASIFDVCDIGIVGDVNEIIPVLIEKLKEP
jgi:electron transfer flavoprotein alpha subunit